jgi:prohibitin 1
MKAIHQSRHWGVYVASFLLLVALLLPGCTVVRPGEVGIKVTLGKIKGKIHEPGVVGFNPFVSQVQRMPTRTVNREVKLNLPSKEGLNVSAEISILYHIMPEMAAQVLSEVGKNYEEVLILSVFRSASADVSARFMAKELHSGQRSVIEEEIRSHMDSIVANRGFKIESVLLKSISLPPGLYSAIEDKLQAEQIVKRKEFELQQEEVEASRKRIEAAGVRDAQKILSEGLTPSIIQWRSLEVFQQLSTSPNAKTIITDGKAPFLIGQD